MLVLPLIRELVLERSVADCFRYLADFSTTEQWDPGVRRAEKETAGAPGLGSVFQLQLDVFGRQVPARYVLTECRPDSRLVFTGEGPGFRVTDTLDFVACGTGATRLRYRAVMQLSWAPAIARAALAPWGERLGDVAMRGLRAALEQDGPETPSAARRLGERMVLPGMLEFTQRGYRHQGSRGLSRRLDGRTVAITGATGGLGLATAQLLGRLGARLLLIGRGVERLRAAEAAVSDFAGSVDIQCYEAELSSLAQVRGLADRLVSEQPRIDVLINNAGALFGERADTDEGHERALAINLLTPALLSRRLLPSLRSVQGRVINVVSGGLYLQPLVLDDLDYRRGDYDGSKAYARAKRGLLALTQRWARSTDMAGVQWQAVHPGWAATPGVAKSLPAFDRAMRPWLRDARMGADSIAWLASHPALDDPRLNGQFWFDRAARPAALLPGTAVSAEQAAALEHEVWSRLGLAR